MNENIETTKLQEDVDKPYHDSNGVLVFPDSWREDDDYELTEEEYSRLALHEDI